MLSLILKKLKNDPSLDILLQDGDKVTIPEFLDHIYIFGEINEGTIRYKEGADFNYYIDKKGGYSPYANKKNVYVLHPNGETTLVSDNKNIFMRQRKENMVLYPGSVIFIPRETAKNSVFSCCTGICFNSWKYRSITCISISIKRLTKGIYSYENKKNAIFINLYFFNNTEYLFRQL